MRPPTSIAASRPSVLCPRAVLVTLVACAFLVAGLNPVMGMSVANAQTAPDIFSWKDNPPTFASGGPVADHFADVDPNDVLMGDGEPAAVFLPPLEPGPFYPMDPDAPLYKSYDRPDFDANGDLAGTPAFAPYWGLQNYVGPVRRMPGTDFVGFPSMRNPNYENRQLGGDFQLNQYGEQGRFYSREHIQSVREEGNETIHSELFTIGGDDGGAWFGGFFGNRFVGNMIHDRPINGESPLRIQIDGILDTADPGWTAEARSQGQYPGTMMVSPNRDFGIFISHEAFGNRVAIRFLNPKGMANIEKGDVYAQGAGRDFSGRQPIYIPPHTPIKITYRMLPEGRGLMNYNTLRYGMFVPHWGEYTLTEPEPAELDKQVIGVEVNQDGTTAEVSYKVVFDNPQDGEEVQGELFDTPRFDPGARITAAEVQRDGEPARAIAGNFDRVSLDKGPFAPGTHREYTVRFTVDALAPNTQPDAARCAADQTEHGLFNRVTLENQGKEELSAVACADAPIAPQPVLLDVDKQAVDPQPEDIERMLAAIPGQPASLEEANAQADSEYGVVKYRVEVANPTTAPITYDLNDTPKFARGITALRVEGRQDGEDYRSLNANQGGYSLDAAQVIDGGKTIAYDVVVLFQHDRSDALIPERCAPGGESGELNNHVSANAGGKTFEDCVGVSFDPDPFLEVTKSSVAQDDISDEDVRAVLGNEKLDDLNQDPDTQTGVSKFRITVTNPTATEVETKVEDLLTLPKGFTRGKTAVRSLDNVDDPDNLPGNGWSAYTELNGDVVSNALRVAPESSTVFEVVAAYTFPKADRDVALECTDQGGTGGIRNVARASAGARVFEDDACAPIVPPKEWQEPIVEKVADTAQPVLDKGRYTLEYTVTVTNPSRNDMTIDVKDEPLLAGLLDDATFTVDGKDATLGGGVLVIAKDLTLGSNKTKEFKVAMSVPGPTARDTAELETLLADRGFQQCHADDKHISIVNRALVTFPGGEKDDIACVPVEITALDRVSLAVRKVDLNQGPLDGAEFTVFEQVPPGQVGAVLPVTTEVQGDAALRYVDDLQIGATYQLVETRSPEGYSLLVEPVTFRVDVVDREPRLVFLGGQDLGVTDVTDEVTVTGVDRLVALEVANVRAGDLPVSGGRGFHGYMLAGFAVVLLAGAVYRRRA